MAFPFLRCGVGALLVLLFGSLTLSQDIRYIDNDDPNIAYAPGSKWDHSTEFDIPAFFPNGTTGKVTPDFCYLHTL